ncbi:hypothetical protein L486_00747 [Kwoniella mangroviensis CBS 10435]|uniref:FHA domain-containing protein n=1 Tax=Kwoniella mangroviensis CBS 10435 TaxID=1331196 RepID=A0A1B9J015_9TREE|nr:hypothetical protein L486_00747 [Kwoniella mangroviensis CBS 10435]
MSQVRMEDSTNKVEPPSDWFISLNDLRSSQSTYFTLTQLLTSSEGKKDSKALVSGGVVLGRKSSTAAPKDGRFDSPIISRAHAQLTLTPNGHVYVTDLGSMHGSSISSATRLTVPLTTHSPVQVINGDTILLGKTVTSNGTNYDPLRLTVIFRHHEFGKGSTTHGGRKSTGRIKPELAQSRFAGVNDESKMRKLIANLKPNKPNHAEIRIASAAIIAAMAQDRADLSTYLPSTSHESPLIQSPNGNDDNIDFNADDSVEFTFEIKGSQLRSGPGLSQESAIEVQSLRSQSPISVRSDTNDSDQENTVPQAIHRFNTYKIPPSILYISEEEDRDSLPRGSSDFDQHEADDDSMTDYEDHEDVAENQGEEADIFPEKISTLPGVPFEDDHNQSRYDDDSEIDNESENGEPEVLGVREDDVQHQTPLHSTPAKSPASRPVDDNESISPDYRSNSPINVPIIKSPLDRDDIIKEYDEDDVSRHSPPSSPNYRAWYSYSSDEEGDIQDPALLLMGGTLDIINTPFVQSQTASLPSPVSHALSPTNATRVVVTAPKTQEQMQGEDEEDRCSNSHEDQEEEHEEEDFNEDQSIVEDDENYSEEEEEDKGIQMEGYPDDGSSAAYDESNYDEDESDRMDYSEDGRSSVFDSDGGQSYDEENEFDDEEEEEDDGEEEEEGDDDDDEDGGSEGEEESERSEIEDEDGEEEEEEAMSPIVNIAGSPHHPQVEVSANVDTNNQLPQVGKMESPEIAQKSNQPAQGAEHHELAFDETDLSKEVKEEMLSQRNRQSSEAQDHLVPTNARDIDERIESNIGKDVDIETSSVDVVAGHEEGAAPTVSDGQLSIERPRTPSFSFSDASSEGPITPESTKKRPLPEDFTIVDHDHISERGTTTSTDLLVPTQARDDTRPIKKIRRIGSAIGYMALGAALGGAGTVYGLMQFAP